MAKEIPILFSTPMVQAILDGRKTMTRRVMKPQIEKCKHDLYVEAEWFDRPTEWVLKDGNAYCGLCGNGVSQSNNFLGIRCPYGKPGDILWVRECAANLNVDFPSMEPYWVYKTDIQIKYQYGPVTWKPSIHVPKSACRIWLEVTSVQVERLKDISEQDAIAEGIEPVPSFDSGNGVSGTQMFKNYTREGYNELLPKDSFASLWISINGTESWAANPWVWVVEFKVLSTTGKPAMSDPLIEELKKSEIF